MYGISQEAGQHQNFVGDDDRIKSTPSEFWSQDVCTCKSGFYNLCYLYY